jgi:hypothetical protein
MKRQLIFLIDFVNNFFPAFPRHKNPTALFAMTRLFTLQKQKQTGVFSRAIVSSVVRDLGT